MLPKRIDRGNEHSAFTNSERQLILAAEALRAGETAIHDGQKVEKSNDEKISLFWRVFGGSILMICTLVVINAYQSLASNIHEVRGDVGRLREASGEYIKKVEFNTHSTTMWTRLQELQAVNASVTVLTSKLTALEQQIKDAESERKEMKNELAQAAVVKDRLATLEEQRKLSEQDRKELLAIGTTLTTLKERDAAMEKALEKMEKQLKDAEVERISLREKLARLEGKDEAKPVKPAGPPSKDGGMGGDGN